MGFPRRRVGVGMAVMVGGSGGGVGVAVAGGVVGVRAGWAKKCSGMDEKIPEDQGDREFSPLM